MVSPVLKSEYILAKTISNITPSILSLTIMFLYSKIFKTVDINYFILLSGVILVAFFHSLIGFLLTYYSKDFTDLVMNIMKVFLIFLLPVILDEFNIVTNKMFKKLVYIFPTKSTLMILMGAAGIVEHKKNSSIGCIYIIKLYNFILFGMERF